MANAVLRTIPCLIEGICRATSVKVTKSQIISLIPAASNIYANLGNNTLQIRFYSQNHGDSAKVQPALLEKVYSGVLTSQVRRVKLFSLTTSVMGVLAQPFIYNELADMKSVPMMLVGCSVFGFFTFINPFLLHYVTKKYITQVDYNSQKKSYVATHINFFCMNVKTEFTPEDVVVPDIPGMFTTFIAKGKAMFLEARLFDDPSHYSKIMGYDKPLDFKLYETSGNDPPQSSKT